MPGLQAPFFSSMTSEVMPGFVNPCESSWHTGTHVGLAGPVKTNDYMVFICNNHARDVRNDQLK